MDPGTRACVAYVAGCIISGSDASHVYDNTRSTRVRVRGVIQGKAVEVFDYDRNCRFFGTLPKLIDYGRNTHVSLEITGKQFSGYDEGSSHYFVGSVSGRSVILHDYGESRHFSYSL